MSGKIKVLPSSERPYEKLEMYGEGSLSNSELLAIIIKSGTKGENSISVAQKIMALKGDGKTDSLRFLQDITIKEFMQIKGIGRVKAIQLRAICELAKRMARPINNINIVIKNSKDVFELLKEELRYEKREFLKTVLLSNKNKIIRIVNITIGASNQAVIEPKDILVECIKAGAPRMILVHNHPSGDPTPSESDVKVTKRIFDAAGIIGVELLDHVVIGDDRYESIFSKIQMN